MKTLMHKLTLDVPDALSVCVTVTTDGHPEVNSIYGEGQSTAGRVTLGLGSNFVWVIQSVLPGASPEPVSSISSLLSLYMDGVNHTFHSK